MEKTVDLTIEEGNKIIAEFMGLKALDWKSSLDNSDMRIWVDEKSEETVFMDAALEYFSSWSWLMHVIEKIEGLQYSVNILRDDCSIYDNSFKNTGNGFRISVKRANKKLEAAWQAVIQFIQWYNQNKIINGK